MRWLIEYSNRIYINILKANIEKLVASEYQFSLQYESNV